MVMIVLQQESGCFQLCKLFHYQTAVGEIS
jgi:hypothetical protein